MAKPLRKGAKGRGPDGRFLPGWQGGPGNPYAKRVAEIRRQMLEAVTEQDLKDMVKAVVQKAKEGDIAAFNAVMDRLLGKPFAVSDLAQVDAFLYKAAVEVIDAERRLSAYLASVKGIFSDKWEAKNREAALCLAKAMLEGE